MSKHQELCAVLTELYSLFVDIGYISTSDVSWPPHSESPLPVDELLKWGYSPVVVELLQAIPRPRMEFALYGETTTINYHDEENIKYTRVAPFYDEEPDQEDLDIEYPTLPAHQVALTASNNNNVGTIILDALNGRIAGLESPCL
jgi:hypothetical protein